MWACVTPPPTNPDDACRIFDERLDWYVAARDAKEEWGVSPALQLAIIHQESAFRAQARPARTRFLWIFPGPRPSSAYGYGQVVDATWERYRVRTGRIDADRDDFADVADFIGWYGSEIRRRTNLPLADSYGFYLSYHEGPGGFLRGSFEAKPWLMSVARRVAERSARYDRQLTRCRAQLDERARAPWWWPF